MSSDKDTISLPQAPYVRPHNFTILPFSVTDPQLWFIWLKNYLLANRIHLQQDKFGHASSLLLDEVADNL